MMALPSSRPFAKLRPERPTGAIARAPVTGPREDFKLPLRR